jgi:hypothetical protein
MFETSDVAFGVGHLRCLICGNFVLLIPHIVSLAGGEIL